MNSGGDVLARGGRSAQFASSGADVTDFEYDMKVRRELVKEKYGLSDAEIEEYATKIDSGVRIDLDPVDLNQDKLGASITVIDKRPNFFGTFPGLDAKEVVKPAPKYPEKKYEQFSPILDRILIKRCADGPDQKLMEDGSVLDTKTGLITAAKYRQHSNIGIVLATGQFVILGGQKIPMADVVRVGDRVTYGDYNSEVFHMDATREIALCDAVQMNYEADPEGLRVVRVQDVRGVERVDASNTQLEEFRANYGGDTSAPGVPVFAKATEPEEIDYNGPMMAPANLDQPVIDLIKRENPEVPNV